MTTQPTLKGRGLETQQETQKAGSKSAAMKIKTCGVKGGPFGDKERKRFKESNTLPAQQIQDAQCVGPEKFGKAGSSKLPNTC